MRKKKNVIAEYNLFSCAAKNAYMQKKTLYIQQQTYFYPSSPFILPHIRISYNPEETEKLSFCRKFIGKHANPTSRRYSRPICPHFKIQSGSSPGLIPFF